MLIKRGIIQSFSPATYTASVLLFEATSHFLSGIPVSNALDGTSGLVGSLCAVLCFDEQNPQDMVVIATYANGASGLPAPAPGRITFVTGYRQINAVAISNGATQTFTLTGGGSGIPVAALGVVYKAYVTGPTAGTSITLIPHAAGDNNAYQSIGNIQVANQYANGGGLLQVDANGQIDIKAVQGNATVTLYTHGYVV
jgi:hypothetical protein